MKLRSNLFLKLFLGFWGIVLFTVTSSVLLERYISDNDDFHSRHEGKHPSRMMRHLFYDLKAQPLDELDNILNQLQKKRKINVLLINSEDKDIFSRPVDPRSLRIAKRLNHKNRRINKHSPNGLLLASKLYRADTGLLRAVITIPPPQASFSRSLQENLWLRLTLAMLISGVLCYTLSRLLTRRLRQLREAAQALARGKLDTPLSVRHWGADETDDLAQDFNIMAQQLQERITAQQRLLQDVSHELRSPLARLRLALALAEKDSVNLANHLQRIEQEAESLDELIAQLLDLPDHAITLDTYIDLVPLLKTLCEEAGFEGKADNKSIRLNTPLTQAELATAGDLLYKALGNVIRNAIKYTANDSTVEVALDKSERGVFVITVNDCGSGVPDAELPRLFDAFYRVDTARTRSTGGYGLGLAIAYRAITQHGGNISASNSDTGLCINIELPAG